MLTMTMLVNNMADNSSERAMCQQGCEMDLFSKIPQSPPVVAPQPHLGRCIRVGIRLAPGGAIESPVAVLGNEATRVSEVYLGNV